MEAKPSYRAHARVAPKGEEWRQATRSHSQLPPTLLLDEMRDELTRISRRRTVAGMSVNELRPLRVQLREMGQTSPPALGQPALSLVVGSSVADIGCGSGLYGYLLRCAWHFTASWQQEGVPACERLVGVDFSPVAIGRLERFGIYDDLRLAEASVLPLEDGSVDTALSMENLEHLFPNEVGPALAELARIARRRVVITTPSPSVVINRTWLAKEIAEAEVDLVPLNYEEFLVLAGCIHKSSVGPQQMKLVGFEVLGSPGQPTQVADSFIYWGEPDRLGLDRLGDVAGMAIQGYPADDGRADWREEYLRFLRASQSVQVGYVPPPHRWSLSASSRAHKR
jgi:SAM-dependent methyltransferase